MASSIRLCNVKKCGTSSCATCHCCQKDLCLDHLKEHKEQMNALLIPLANEINILFERLNNFDRTATARFATLARWRTNAHQTIDKIFKEMSYRLLDQKSEELLENLVKSKNYLNELVQKQAANRENIDSLTKGIDAMKQEIDNFQNTDIHLSPLVIDVDEIILSSNVNKKPRIEETRKTVKSNNQSPSNRERSSFQIFVQTPSNNHTIIWAEPSATVLTLKQRIAHKTGFNEESQRLTYMGKILQDTFTASMYDIQPLTTIKMNQILPERQEIKQDES